ILLKPALRSHAERGNEVTGMNGTIPVNECLIKGFPPYAIDKTVINLQNSRFILSARSSVG
ncbi:MAG: hypothetical protein ABW101_17465, partial [Candidatus Thiodiazotropha sp.]